jgi:hypothetical protein
MNDFKEALSDCNLVDIGFIGDPFTWKRGRVRERLDRAVVSPSWSALYPGAVLRHLDFCKSDHRTIMLDTDYKDEASQRKPRPKYFEAKWLNEKTFRDVVKEAWQGADREGDGGGVKAKLGRLQEALHAWDATVLMKPRKRLRKAQRDFDIAVSGVLTDESEAKAKELAELIEILLEQEEIQWMQRSRANWLKEGDHNTSFFHNFATARRKKNFIKKLLINGNYWVEGTEELKPIILDYFSNLFSSEVEATDPAFLDKIQPRVSVEMNEKLRTPFTAEDVKKAAFSIGDFKAPRPDGIHAVFYKRFWDLRGVEITTEVLQAINSGVIPNGWNDTTIVLIP